MFKANPSDSESPASRPTDTENDEGPRNLNYRCPVCGRIVDATNAEQILLHHEHVTHPQDFVIRKPAAA